MFLCKERIVTGYGCNKINEINVFWKVKYFKEVENIGRYLSKIEIGT